MVASMDIMVSARRYNTLKRVWMKKIQVESNRWPTIVNKFHPAEIGVLNGSCTNYFINSKVRYDVLIRDLHKETAFFSTNSNPVFLGF